MFFVIFAISVLIGTVLRLCCDVLVLIFDRILLRTVSFVFVIMMAVSVLSLAAVIIYVLSFFVFFTHLIYPFRYYRLVINLIIESLTFAFFSIASRVSSAASNTATSFFSKNIADVSSASSRSA